MSPSLPKIKKLKDILPLEESSLTMNLLKSRLKDYNSTGNKKMITPKLQNSKAKVEAFSNNKINFFSKNALKSSAGFNGLTGLNSPFNFNKQILNFGSLKKSEGGKNKE